jgi:hypothetical protein
MRSCRYSFEYYSYIFPEVVRKSADTSVRIVGLIPEKSDYWRSAKQNETKLGFLNKNCVGIILNVFHIVSAAVGGVTLNKDI